MVDYKRIMANNLNKYLMGEKTLEETADNVIKDLNRAVELYLHILKYWIRYRKEK